MDKGKAEGKAEGIAKGAALLLVQLIEKRFGAVPASVRERILAADLNSTQIWCDRVLGAPDLQSVFAQE